ncbi:DUF4143 domain-containing protein [Pelagibacterium halotolerans]|uniref:DUF4143 domain-containing protein n=1 Tax=Pelagibacterium halotolerans TaxID=531813 RepID=UPI00384D1EDF
MDRLNDLLGPHEGPFETFVFSELRKIASRSDQRCSFSHSRDKDRNEVDLVLENRRGEAVGIEVKASATVSAGEFSGMRARRFSGWGQPRGDRVDAER